MAELNFNCQYCGREHRDTAGPHCSDPAFHRPDLHICSVCGGFEYKCLRYGHIPKAAIQGGQKMGTVAQKIREESR